MNNNAMSVLPSPLNRPFLLLCEGKDEESFFTAWLQELRLFDVQVLDYKGKNNLKNTLELLQKRTGFDKLQRLAITRDADADPVAAFDSVKSAVKKLESTQVNSPAVFILPGNGKTGALETLFLESKRDHPFHECIEKFFSCIAVQGWQESGAVARNDKARAQVWIATSSKPDARFGHLVGHGRGSSGNPESSPTEKEVDLNHPAFSELKDFLLKTFGV